jgi:ubiquinone/menaquinone biosynthesis C-methylase UbiE
LESNRRLNDEHAQRYIDAVAEAEEAGDEQFFFWFDVASNLDEYFESGLRTLEREILTPTVIEALGSTKSASALEIGSGGGRILLAACSKFQHVTGIDVHQSHGPVKRKLAASGLDNYTLSTGDGSSIPSDTASLDFVYSYIVLMHLPSIETFRSYIAETRRALRPGGVAQLYYGRYSKMSWKARLRWYLPGYRELTKAKTNHTSLVVSQRLAHKIAQDQGFTILDSGYSLKPNQVQKGVQNYMTL